MGQALEQALAYWRAPALLAAARQRPLPDDVLEVVRIAAGDRVTAEFAAAALGTSADELCEAAPFYLQQLLFAPGASSYRVLGVNPDAPDARIKEHYRWLVRWLHPDRNPDEWEALYADRVNRAWQDLRQPEKRAAYDAGLADGWGEDAAVGPEGPPTRTASPAGAPSGANLRSTPVDAPILSARTTQRLPIIVLGSFGLLAGALLALMWYAQNPRTPRTAMPPVAIAAEPAVAETPTEAVAVIPAAEAGVVATASEPSEPPAPTPPVGAPSGANPQLATTPAGGPSGPTPRTPKPPTPPPAAPARAVPSVTPAPTTAAAATATATAARPAPAIAAQPAAPAPQPEATPTPITEQEALALLEQFTTAYRRGDLRALMRLFTRDATNNRGGRAEIAYDYQELFDDSDARELRLTPNGWLQGETSATVLARFEARVSRAGRWRTGRSEGEIRFDLAREDGVLRIKTIRHDER
ncbi:MAG: hypothetical protein ABS41_07470 [Arenimonas sp. SCN 70-307]|nr:MAG: hypothetical protein ABS41_07470 [Arenimonas sp. SCN 70-307]